MTGLNLYFLHFLLLGEKSVFIVKTDFCNSVDDNFDQVQGEKDALRGWNMKRMNLLIYSNMLESKSMIHFKKRNNLKKKKKNNLENVCHQWS